MSHRDSRRFVALLQDRGRNPVPFASQYYADIASEVYPGKFPLLGVRVSRQAEDSGGLQSAQVGEEVM